MVFAQPRLGALNRAQQVRFEASGKGLNVARAITYLGYPAVAIAPLGGAFGDMIAETVRTDGVDLRAIPAASTRCNVKVVDEQGTLSEFNASGGVLEPAIWQACQDALEVALSPSQKPHQHHAPRYLVLSGSLPPGLDTNTYATLTEIWQAKGVRVIVDASGDALRNAYDARPWLLKPNQEELATLGYEVSTLEHAQDAALALQASGVANVIVTLGEKGAVFALEQSCHRVSGFKVSVTSPVAAGDTLLAAFLALLHDAPATEQDLAACRWVLAAASARVRDGHYPNRNTISQVLAENEDKTD